MKLRNDIEEFLKEIPKNVTLVCATKYLNSLEMKDIYSFGLNNFGENRVEAFLDKYDSLKDLDIKWHFIGHLQRNKAVKIINKIDYLHSLDSLELAKIINKERITPLNVFIEVNINNEESKSGIKKEELKDFFEIIKEYKNINVIGLMTMAIKHDNELNCYKTFETLADLARENKLKELSMGMTDDYKEAILAGSTFIRLGRVLYGK